MKTPSEVSTSGSIVIEPTQAIKQLRPIRARSPIRSSGSIPGTDRSTDNQVPSSTRTCAPISISSGPLTRAGGTSTLPVPNARNREGSGGIRLTIVARSILRARQASFQRGGAGTRQAYDASLMAIGTRNLVVITLDSLRFDSWVEAAPANLARIGEVERRYSYASWTAPSHCKLLMGLLPHS